MAQTFKVGDKAFDIRMGWGVVREVRKGILFGLTVDFLMEHETYTHDGKSNQHDRIPMLRKVEYTLNEVTEWSAGTRLLKH